MDMTSDERDHSTSSKLVWLLHRPLRDLRRYRREERAGGAAPCPLGLTATAAADGDLLRLTSERRVTSAERRLNGHTRRPSDFTNTSL